MMHVVGRPLDMELGPCYVLLIFEIMKPKDLNKQI